MLVLCGQAGHVHRQGTESETEQEGVQMVRGCPDNGLSTGLLSPVSAGTGLPSEEVHSSLVSVSWRSIIRLPPVNLRQRHKSGFLLLFAFISPLQDLR